MASDVYVSPELREHPSKYDADALMRFLVQDAVRSHATDLHWFTAALVRVGEVRRRRGRETVGESVERAMKALLDEVETLTGMRRLPLHSGPIIGMGQR